MSEVKKCPKCSGVMAKDRRLISYTDISLAKEGEFVGDTVIAFYCESCGYIELYKEMKKGRNKP